MLSAANVLQSRCWSGGGGADRARGAVLVIAGPAALLGKEKPAPLRRRDCRHQVELIPLKWRSDTAPRRPCLIGAARLVCSQCGSRRVNTVVDGT